MSKIRIPDFTADLSLPPAERQYKTVNKWSEGVIGQSVIPQLRCLEWHCQGSECICIRITTAELTSGDVATTRLR
jgi:hypothetical protein